MQGEETLLVLSYKGKELDNITWQQLQVPHTYLADNWPIQVTLSLGISIH